MNHNINRPVGNLRIAVFASGTGTNFQAINKSKEDGLLDIEICGLVTNNPEAGAKTFAETKNIPVAVINKKRFPGQGEVTSQILKTLKEWDTGIVVLAGYMKILAPEIIKAYPGKILNIHPALLPAFGGKGMYGMHVHEAVIEHGVRFTGVTVHIVDFEYDTGPIVLQRIIPVQPDDTPEILQKRVLQEEYKIYSDAIRLFVENRITVSGRKVIVRELNAQR